MPACTRIKYLALSMLWADGWEHAATLRAALTALCLCGARVSIGQRFGCTVIKIHFTISSIVGTTLCYARALADKAPSWNSMCPVGMVTPCSVLLSCGKDQ